MFDCHVVARSNCSVMVDNHVVAGSAFSVMFDSHVVARSACSVIVEIVVTQLIVVIISAWCNCGVVCYMLLTVEW